MYAQLCSWNNLFLAYSKASRGKRGRPVVAQFEYRLEDNLVWLQQELLDKIYRPGAYYSFYIHEPKRRLISAAPFRDRVVHHALCNIIEPMFERTFIHDSYANRVGKGTHRALNRCQQLAQRFRYVLQCDIRQFFPAIDHAILRAILCKGKQSGGILARKIDDPDVMWLVDHIMESGVGVLSQAYDMVYFSGDNLLAAHRPRGLPIGNLTSQFWANCYLNPFDHFVKRELGACKQRGGYVRYVDDCLFFANDKPTLWAWRDAIIERLAQFRLTIHPGTHPHPVEEGIPFLGFVVTPDRKHLKRRKGIHFRRRFHGLVQCYAEAEITLDQLTASAQGWANHTRYGNTVGLRKVLFGSILIPPIHKVAAISQSRLHNRSNK
ncbi:MAG: RNA-dependent DNA polymerase [Chloroflexi bacterium]|nr:RNA-dependent DNA polymerase [Chloroflexota bacterium]